MPALDYIRITGVADVSGGPAGDAHVTYNIEYSGDAEFSAPKMGIITLKVSDLVDPGGLDTAQVRGIAGRLVRQILVRERDDDGSIGIYHILGLPLQEWLRKNTPLLNQ